MGIVVQDNHATVSINCSHVSNTVHPKLFILVYMKLVTKIGSSVWHRIDGSTCALSSCYSISWECIF